MHIDTRNKNKVVVIREGKDGVTIVKNVKTGQKYLVDKAYLKEI